MDYLMPKPYFVEEQQWSYLTDSLEDKRFILFGIRWKVNVTAWLEIELAYFETVMP